MNPQIKTYFGIALIIVLMVFAVSAASYVRTYSRSIEPSTFRSFSVSGEGEVVAIPDVATFSFTVLTQGGVNLTSLQEESSSKSNNAMAFIKSKGVKTKDISTRSYNVSPRYQRFNCEPTPFGGQAIPCPPSEIVGYEISQTTTVKVRDFDKIGELLAGIVENGANSVSQLSFAIDDPTRVENDARAEAIEKAKDKAKAIAKAGDFSLGRLLSIREGSTGPIFRAQSLGISSAFEDAAVAPSIEPGSQEITISVTLTYEIR